MTDLIEDLAPVITGKLKEVLRADEGVLVSLPGAFKEGLICTMSRCLIIKAGFMTGNTFGSNVFQLPYAAITSAEVKFGLMSGYFEISAGGMQNTAKSYWDNSKGSGNAKAAPNSISLVDRKMAAKFRSASDFILSRAAQARSSPSMAAGSVADEIQKLVALVDKGYLTREEFDQQKRTLLARSVFDAE
ncbi:SHOCT domain-containing protein [Mesorhizobium sp. B3-1-7]|uniref:SHOCT domain-containing protein n=1 Tax=Mesorhizobium sp. B3-1-7 TaxID=2589894 RepID=UPI0011270AB7|nr:SHOCT domain-containing protein [Mesorhizobium sp. B3-1-7]TPI63953.1 SHOCT domain-containing protein [Mesorhizobium sp. B3-1-7]